MKTRLLRRLRRKANKEYYIVVWTDSGVCDVQYGIMHREPLCPYCENTVWGGFESAVVMLNRYRRQFIKNQIEQLRLKRLYR